MFKKCVVLMLLIAIGGSTALFSGQKLAEASSQSLDLSPCKFDVGIGDAKHQVDAKCGIMEVPEVWSKPSGNQLDIHVVVLAAQHPNSNKPIFHFEGGPGGSAITNFGQVWYSAYELMRADHDIVLIDQRGTGQSASLQCTEITNAALDDLAKKMTDDEEKTLDNTRLSDCLKRLSATTNPADYYSDALADDTDAIRAALGYDQIDIFGNSYGTWLGQVYLHRHGEHVHALVLDSVTGPWNYPFLDFPNNAQASLDKIFAMCKADTDCNTKYPDLPGALTRALDKLDKTPVTISAPSLLTGDSHTVTMTKSRLLDALGQTLYQSSLAGFVPMIVSQAAAGEYTIPAGILISVAQQAQDESLGLYYSVTCAESNAFYTSALIKKYQQGSVFDAASDIGDAQCKLWRSAELNAQDVAPVKSDRPVLILSGNLDPITPVSFGEETHQRLSNSTLVVFPYQAHGVIVGSRCAQKIVEGFFNAPDQPVNSDCAKQDIKPVFAGAYNVNLVPYTDPGGKFVSKVPEGWQKDKTVDDLTFFDSPDGNQLLGVGVLKNTKLADAQKQVLATIAKAYGPVEVQQQMTTSVILFSITIVAHTTSTPDQFYSSLLMLRQNGADTCVAWQSAPSNIFQAVSLAVVPYVFVGTLPV